MSLVFVNSCKSCIESETLEHFLVAELDLVWPSYDLRVLPFQPLFMCLIYARPCSFNQSSAIAATRSYRGPDPSTPSGVIRILFITTMTPVSG
jgi:hypothetical protein